MRENPFFASQSPLDRPRQRYADSVEPGYDIRFDVGVRADIECRAAARSQSLRRIPVPSVRPGSVPPLGSHAVLSAQKVYAMLENESLWQAANRCHEILAAAKIPHALLGGVAVCLYGYRRNTADVDLLVRKADSSMVHQSLEREGFVWNARGQQFNSPSGVVIELLLADDRAGSDSEVRLPDPGDEHAVTEIEGLPVLRLSRLIETKIACGMGNLRRTHKDFADVIELIIQNHLDSSFARFLHKSLRQAYRQLVRQSRGGH